MADARARRRIRGRPSVPYVRTTARGALLSAGARDLHAHVREPTALPRGARDGGRRVQATGGSRGEDAGHDTPSYVPNRVTADARVRRAQLGRVA